MKFDIELVGKIGSMALINRENHDIDYNIFCRLGRELSPGMVWVSSGATEIGRLDYLHRVGKDAGFDTSDEIKTDYAAQGQPILMKYYRDFIDPRYSVRQVLVEHQHFNDEEKRKHLKELLIRAAAQNAIPIINYNDAVSFEETRKMEIQHLRKCKEHVVELVDNDETAAQIACLMRTKSLLILSCVDGIYADPQDPDSLIREISGKNAEEVIENIEECQKSCHGASRVGANGAFAKLEYIKAPVLQGTTVYIASARYGIKDILEEKAPCTKIAVR